MQVGALALAKAVLCNTTSRVRDLVVFGNR